MSLLTIVQNACDRAGLTRPSTAYANTELQIRQLVALAQQEGLELSKRHAWQALVTEKTFTSTAAETQTGAIPSDFDRFVDGTFFNRTAKRPVQGPMTAQEWQFHKSVVASTIIEAFRQRGNSVLITPAPTATTTTYAYEYVTKNFCESSGGTDQSAWAADTDTGLLSEELMTLGVVWRFKKAKGLDYGEDFRAYETMVAQAIARDGGKPTLNVGTSKDLRRARAPFVQDGSWNL